MLGASGEKGSRIRAQAKPGPISTLSFENIPDLSKETLRLGLASLGRTAANSESGGIGSRHSQAMTL